jgi:hypothetical protein
MCERCGRRTGTELLHSGAGMVAIQSYLALFSVFIVVVRAVPAQHHLRTYGVAVVTAAPTPDPASDQPTTVWHCVSPDEGTPDCLAKCEAKCDPLHPHIVCDEPPTYDILAHCGVPRCTITCVDQDEGFESVDTCPCTVECRDLPETCSTECQIIGGSNSDLNCGWVCHPNIACAHPHCTRTVSDYSDHCPFTSDLTPPPHSGSTRAVPFAAATALLLVAA